MKWITSAVAVAAKLVRTTSRAVVTIELILSMSCLLASAGRSLADVQINKVGEGSDALALEIFNTISKNDADYVSQQENSLKGTLDVFLNSPGGDVDAAEKIGRIIRKYLASVFVRANAKCFSSCALIYIAGSIRTNLGVVGLHRPYLSSAPLSQEEIEQRVPVMLQGIKEYIQAMGVTDLFYQEMVNTEPSNIRLYSGDSIKQLVPENDPTADEIRIAHEARQYGTDTAEMRKRDQEVDYRCASLFQGGVPAVSAYRKCAEPIKWGPSESVYEERIHSPKYLKCGLSDEDRRTLLTLDKRSQYDFPPYLKALECMRDAMLGR